MAMELPKPVQDRIAELTDEELAFRGWTREYMRERFLARMERDKSSPQIGEEAPDFRLEKLTPSGKRTGDYLSLSELRGKPTGLIFGSYT